MVHTTSRAKPAAATTRETSVAAPMSPGCGQGERTEGHDHGPGVMSAVVEGSAMSSASSPADAHTFRANEPTLTREAAASTRVEPTRPRSIQIEWTRLAVTARRTSEKELHPRVEALKQSRPGRELLVLQDLRDGSADRVRGLAGERATRRLLRGKGGGMSACSRGTAVMRQAQAGGPGGVAVPARRAGRATPQATADAERHSDHRRR